MRPTSRCAGEEEGEWGVCGFESLHTPKVLAEWARFAVALGEGNEPSGMGGSLFSGLFGSVVGAPTGCCVVGEAMALRLEKLVRRRVYDSRKREIAVN